MADADRTTIRLPNRRDRDGIIRCNVRQEPVPTPPGPSDVLYDLPDKEES